LVSTFYKVYLYTVLSTCNEVTFSCKYLLSTLLLCSQPCRYRSRKVRIILHVSQFPPSESNDDEDAFFRSRHRPHVNVQDVVANYLHDASDTLASLDVWPSLKPTFIKLNTSLPATAACERLFSMVGRVFVPRQGRISDKCFEQQLLAYSNKHLL